MIRYVVVLAFFVIGCQREPAIVVRFDPADAAMTRRDRSRVNDDAGSLDAGLVIAAKAGECAADGDCVVVPEACCDCANGGKQRAIPRHEEPKLRARRTSACKETMCTMMVGTDPTCGQRPACVEGRCVMRAARPDEVKHRIVIPKKP